MMDARLFPDSLGSQLWQPVQARLGHPSSMVQLKKLKSLGFRVQGYNKVDCSVVVRSLLGELLMAWTVKQQYMLGTLRRDQIHVAVGVRGVPPKRSQRREGSKASD